MKEFCHTCGGELAAGSGESPFCPHCGAPQLTLSLDYQSVETGGEPKVEAPGPVAAAAPRLKQVDWQMAIRCAVVVGAVVAILNFAGERFPLATALGSLCTVGASVIALGLYQSRRPAAWMDAGIGARIGVVVGLVVAASGAASLAVASLLARYGLHREPSIDTQLTTALSQLQKSLAANAAQPDVLRFVSLPEFRAGFLLAALGLGSLFVLLISTVGGAMGGMLRMRRGTSV